MNAHTMIYAEPPGGSATAQLLSAKVPALPGKEKQRAESCWAEWVAHITHKDEAALGALYQASISRVWGLALRITRQPEAAEEVAEDVYMQVWRQAARFDARRGSVLAWLLTICRSRALDYLRRRDDAEPHPEPETLADETMAAADPQDLLLAVERDNRMYAVLDELDAVQRQLLALAFFKGLSHQEVSAHTGMPLGTVKTHLRKALAAMRISLGEGGAVVGNH
jgi:RNA polymerase sigma-70 factor (ECF subfamily)